MSYHMPHTYGDVLPCAVVYEPLSHFSCQIFSHTLHNREVFHQHEFLDDLLNAAFEKSTVHREDMGMVGDRYGDEHASLQ